MIFDKSPIIKDQIHYDVGEGGSKIFRFGQKKMVTPQSPSFLELLSHEHIQISG